jgi:hypothetical protein
VLLLQEKISLESVLLLQQKSSLLVLASTVCFSCKKPNPNTKTYSQQPQSFLDLIILSIFFPNLLLCMFLQQARRQITDEILNLNAYFLHNIAS